MLSMLSPSKTAYARDSGIIRDAKAIKKITTRKHFRALVYETTKSLGTVQDFSKNGFLNHCELQNELREKYI